MGEVLGPAVPVAYAPAGTFHMTDRNWLGGGGRIPFVPSQPGSPGRARPHQAAQERTHLEFGEVGSTRTTFMVTHSECGASFASPSQLGTTAAWMPSAGSAPPERGGPAGPATEPVPRAGRGSPRAS